MQLKRKFKSSLQNCFLTILLILSGCTSQHNEIVATPISASKTQYNKLVKEGKFRATQKTLNNKSSTSNNYNINAPTPEEGYASWYSSWFHGKKTFSGVEYDEFEYSAAHRTLPIPSVVKVTNLNNGKHVLVVINDRGPFKGGKQRIIDLSKRAAQDLDFIKSGITKVKVEYLINETKQLLEHLPPKEKEKALISLSYLN